MPFASSHPSQPITGGLSSRSQSLTAPAATGTLNRLTISVICSLVKRTSLIEFRKTWTSLSGTSYNQAFLRSIHQLHSVIRGKQRRTFIWKILIQLIKSSQETFQNFRYSPLFSRRSSDHGPPSLITRPFSQVNTEVDFWYIRLEGLIDEWLGAEWAGPVAFNQGFQICFRVESLY